MQACVQCDKCQSCDVGRWEDVLNSCNTSVTAHAPPIESEWNHKVLRVFRGREAWLQCMLFVETAQASADPTTTAIVLAPHLQNPSCSQHSETSSQCWSLAECSSVVGMQRLGVLLRAAGFTAVALIARDWMALQAMAQQQAGTLQLRQVVDEALLFAAKRPAL